MTLCRLPLSPRRTQGLSHVPSTVPTQEVTILKEVSLACETLLAQTFEAYHSLSEKEASGVLAGGASGPESPAPALAPAVRLFGAPTWTVDLRCACHLTVCRPGRPVCCAAGRTCGVIYSASSCMKAATGPVEAAVVRVTMPASQRCLQHSAFTPHFESCNCFKLRLRWMQRTFSLIEQAS